MMVIEKVSKQMSLFNSVCKVIGQNVVSNLVRKVQPLHYFHFQSTTEHRSYAYGHNDDG